MKKYYLEFTPENKLRDWKDEVKAKNDSIASLVAQWFKKSEDTLADFVNFSDPSKRENSSRIFVVFSFLIANIYLSKLLIGGRRYLYDPSLFVSPSF